MIERRLRELSKKLRDLREANARDEAELKAKRQRADEAAILGAFEAAGVSADRARTGLAVLREYGRIARSASGDLLIKVEVSGLERTFDPQRGVRAWLRHELTDSERAFYAPSGGTRKPEPKPRRGRYDEQRNAEDIVRALSGLPPDADLSPPEPSEEQQRDAELGKLMLKAW